MVDYSDEKKEPPPSLKEQEASFAGTFFSDAVVSAQLIQTAYIGHKLGCYTALKDDVGEDGLTPVEVATNANSSQEWLEQQTVARWIRCDNATAASNHRRFVLPHAHVSALANPDSLSYVMPLAILIGGTGKTIDSLVKAYQNDTGVSWDEIGEDAREAQDAMNRPVFLQKLASAPEECLDDETMKELKMGHNRVAVICSGYAYSSIGVAKHFESAKIDAF